MSSTCTASSPSSPPAENGTEDPISTVDHHLDTPLHDDLLRLIFTACHPCLGIDAQVALTLRTLGGSRTPEIARAFLVSEATLSQRISRAKKTLTRQDIAFALPAAVELPARLEVVIAVVYLIFNEGYAATAGADWTRPELCSDALRLARLLATLQPEQAEVHGMLSLLELQSARMSARRGDDGTPVLLADQDRTRWDTLLIHRATSPRPRSSH